MFKKPNLIRLYALLFCSLLFAAQLSAQVSINQDNSNPDPSAMLDIKSNARGLLIPRLSSVQRAGIAAPATGLMVYDITTNSFWFYNGTAWKEITLNTDNQMLSLTGTTLAIEDGNSVDLAGIDTDTDDQTLSLSGTTLTIADGNSVDLASIDTDTDTDDQNLSLTGTTLAIEDGNSVDLAGIDTDTDDQTLSLSGTVLSIEGGNSVDLGTLPGDNDWTLSGSDLYNANAGNVGIGTASPDATARLHLDIGSSFNQGFLATGDASGSATVPNLGAGNRMMFYPGKAAFRAGRVTGTQWDQANTGFRSTAFGTNTTASGVSSTAMGEGTTASDSYSTAMGRNTIAGATVSTAMGEQTTASGYASTAMGSLSTASGFASTAMGEQTTASGYAAAATGFLTTASGNYSVAQGDHTKATGTLSTAIGKNIEARGDYSVAIALNDQNGTVVTKDNTMAIMGGNVGIGTTNPNATARLHVNLGSSTSDGFMVSGTFDNAATSPNLSSGSYMMFYPGKAAFRAGLIYANGTQWNDVNVGYISTAFGNNTLASGNYSTAFGRDTKATGALSTAMGELSTASGDYSTALGANAVASGNYSTAFGNSTLASNGSSTAFGRNTQATGAISTAMGGQTTASGDYSTAMGNQTTASGLYATAMGFKTKATGDNALAIGENIEAQGSHSIAIALDNQAGTVVSQNNTMAILGGDIGIGTANPQSRFHAEGPANGAGDSDFVAIIRNTQTSALNGTRYNGLKIQAGKTLNNNADSRMIAFYRTDNIEIGSIRQNNSNTVSYNTSSDIRLKQHIVPTHYSIADLMRVEVRDYEFRAEPGQPHTGFIAQQLYEVYPHAVAKGSDDVKTNPWMVDYGQMTPLLVKAIQDQQAIIEAQKLEIDALKEQNDKLASQNSAFGQRLEQIEAALRRSATGNPAVSEK
ncbi:MAG: tail fiber domain-containing protein [Saprospiraceae bacterium]|nr:tail fiber domain-containing protein [Saprospiraceae bacterium]